MDRSLLVLIPIFLAQYQIDPLRPTEELKLIRKIEAQAVERSSNAISAQQRQEFEKKTNAMIEALASFTEAYNKSRGQVWPDPEAKLLRKAIIALEKTPTWVSGDQTK